MTRGPGTPTEVKGHPEAFDKQGRVRAGYRHLDSMVPARPSGQVQPPTRVSSLRPRPQRMKQIIIPPLRTDPIGARYKGRLSHFIDMPETRCSGWKPPRSWPKDFPRHPMHIPDDAPKCEICASSGDCKCIQVIRGLSEPRVVDDGPRGEGLVAVARLGDAEDVRLGQRPLYRRGDVMGELLGDIKNPMSRRDGNSIKINREDLGRRPVDGPLAYLYCEDISNIWRKANHTCQGYNTGFFEKTVTYKRRIVAEATRDIYVGDQLLVHYGREFWAGRENGCACRSQRCVSTTAQE
jgi:hypothetical protein